MSPYKPNAVHAASERQYTAGVGEVQVLGMVTYLPVPEGGARRLMHGLVRLTQFCVSLIALWSQKGSFQIP